ncbi:unnamed protein product [Soboliphyme baturini]|uniref:Nicotinamide N-methyltransferase-like n=1 Tax=Soboliphyme baturini TaxID=241478 RepID=A0A183IAI4_9BILA|nr:unnamed protein product [Soboliphyme baturini]
MLVPQLTEEQHVGSMGDASQQCQDMTLLAPRDHKNYFEPQQYLNEYYGSSNMIGGLKLPIAFLPSVAARLPHCSTLLDVGSGPTVYVAMGFRHKVDNIYLSDFADQNRRELQNWCRGKANFDWRPTAEAIAKLEGNSDEWHSVEEVARKRVSAILYCNVHNKPVLPPPYAHMTFDVVTSVFCLEYASSTSAEYQLAVKNLCSLIKPGGWLFLGGALEEKFYTLGSKRFTCYYLTEEELLQALHDNGIDVHSQDFSYYNSDDVFVVFGKKVSN